MPTLEHSNLNLKSIAAEKAAKDADCALIVTDHKVFDYNAIVKLFPIVIDTRNALKGVTSEKIFKL